MPKVSIIIPVYNVEEYLEVCLESLAGQSFPDAEYILIDDGSTDGSGAICDRWAEADARFVVVHKENGGVSSARNLGLELARGDYIGFSDSDDWMEPDGLEKLVSMLEENPRAGVACAGFYEYFDQGRTRQLRPQNRQMFSGAGNTLESLRNVLLRYSYFTAVWAKLFRRSLIWEKGRPELFDRSLGYGEDEKWLISILLRSQQGVFSPDAIYHWRYREGSATHENCVSPRRMSILKAKRAAIDLLQGTAKDLDRLARSRMYNDTVDLQVLAYCWNDHAALRDIRHQLRGTWLCWLGSCDVLLLRKAKVIVVRIMMALHMPASWVQYVFDIKRTQK